MPPDPREQLAESERACPRVAGLQVAAAVAEFAKRASYRGQFVREPADSDALHWGEGEVSAGPDVVALMGSLAPGPDYQIYLVGMITRQLSYRA